jgi:signal transduction histidine kinase
MPRASIRARMAAWHAGAVFVVLLLTTLALHTALRRRIIGDFDRSQAASIAMVSRVFERDFPEFPGVEPTVHHVYGEVVFPDRLLEFVRPDGSVYSRDEGHLAEKRKLDPPERAMIAPLHARLAPGWQLRLRSSAAGPTRTITLIDGWLVVTTPLFALVAGLLGWWLAGRALAPIAAMADAAEQIGGSEPESRLPIADPGDELGRLGIRFNALLERLESTFGQQRRFLADAAHELRTPAARMLSQVEMMLADEPDPARHAALTVLADDLRRSAVLLGALLQLARTDAGERPAAHDALFLDDLALEQFNRALALAHAGGVRLETGRIEEAPVRGEAESLSRVVANLLDNAIRYTPAGGSVMLQVWCEGPRCMLELQDTGIGLAGEEPTRVFERFFRGRRARQLAPEGTGLGLAIAEAILHQHGGSIVLRSADGGGTQVVMQLPLQQAVPTASATA